MAKALHRWLPLVLQGAQPFFSGGIETGRRWTPDIAQALEESQYAILCLAPGNTEKPWLLFEAGAVSKHVGRSNVAPLLFKLDHGDVSGPLAQFQSVRFEHDGVWEIVHSINAKLAHPLEDRRLKDTFEKWWPDLSEESSNWAIPEDVPTPKPASPDEKILNEILGTVRNVYQTQQHRYREVANISDITFYDQPLRLSDLTEAIAKLEAAFDPIEEILETTELEVLTKEKYQQMREASGTALVELACIRDGLRSRDR